MSVIRSHVSSLTTAGVSASSRRGLAAWTNSEIVPSFFTAPSSRLFQPSRFERSALRKSMPSSAGGGGDVASEYDRALGLECLGNAAADAAGAAGDQGALALEKFHAHARHASRSFEGRQYWRRRGWTWRWSSGGSWKHAPPRSGWSWPGWSFPKTGGWRRRGNPSPTTMPIEVRGQLHPYVSRGGLKLEKALDHFTIPVTGRIALDVGSSTGGLHRLPAAARRGEGLRGGCRDQPARVETAHRSARRVDGEDQHPRRDAHADSRTGRSRRLRCLVRRPAAGPAVRPSRWRRRGPISRR